MNYALFLDDERFPPNYPFRDDWLIARNFDEACDIVHEFGCPSMISFDHDLGTGKNGLDFAHWLIEQNLDGTIQFPNNFVFKVHSMNPVGAANIQNLMDKFLEFKSE